MSHSIVHNLAEQRYEIHVDGTLAGFTEARHQSDVVTMPHTEVFEQFAGQGLGSELVGGALDDIQAQGKRVRATCPYVARFIGKHAEYADLLA